MTRKKTLVIGLGIIASLCGVGAAFASSADIQMIIDGRQLVSEVQPLNRNGHVMVPIRFVSEAVGAKVDWNGKTKTVSIDTQGKKSLQREVKQFERGLAPITADQAVTLYMNGVQQRNAALQYASFSDELKKKSFPDFQAMNWVTGTSSPWLDSWKIKNQSKINENTIKYIVETQYTTSTGPIPVDSLTLTVVHQQDHWFIASIGDK